MEKLLILGTNTRPLINSALKLNYKSYSGSYFKTADFEEPFKSRSVLKQKAEKSCGSFEEKFNSLDILNLCKDWIWESDHIILSSGISPEKIDLKNKKKIIGNKKTKNIEDKYKFYKKIKNKYNTPQTIKINSVDDLNDFLKENKEKTFILKQINGSGGYGIKLINYNNFLIENKNKNNKKSKEEDKFLDIEFPMILQKYIEGDNLSSSLLSTTDESKTILISENINNSYFLKIMKKNSKNITATRNRKETNYNSDYDLDFRYSGNISPVEKGKYNEDILEEIKKISEQLILDFKLIGSNGVDLILNDGEIYVIEINPRFQGTYESVEKLLNINLLKYHIDASNGILNETYYNAKNKKDIIKNPSAYCFKKIIYTEEKIKFNGINNEKEPNNSKRLKNSNSFKADNFKNNNIQIVDIPLKEAVLEKNQPFLTLIGLNKDLSILKSNINDTIEKIESSYTYT
ncbi:ATP-grasp domain-containing protein [Methanobrevibacter curvatus]|uniref:Carbamoyl-phosphate synthase large chain n=1 Tax=Methanobrevibacter curvatus TaxID=49547 RepID=A0A166CW57_9EURY|nr:ATP-grasp domain-containing protein [Methanobrevibacter curvatus]KZX14926.1 carbamoyl-phosphate synthase large chain [Methanobrevibacter curvatus]